MAEKPNPYRIDPDRLDQEWSDQPGLTRQAGYAEADADFAASRAKAKVDVTYAQLELMVRRNPDQFGLDDKATVGEVKARIMVHPEYQAAVEALHRAEYALKIATADKFAMVDRRKGLENMVELRQIEYYGEREPRPLSPGAAGAVAQARKRSARDTRD